MFESLDIRYVPSRDIDTVATHYIEVLGAETDVEDPGAGHDRGRTASQRHRQILLSGHLHGQRPILVYRVTDYARSLTALRAAVSK